MTTPKPIPDPEPIRQWRAAKGDEWGPGAVLANSEITLVIACAGARTIRARILDDVGGTLSAVFCRGNEAVTEYALNNPSNVTVTANVETLMDVADHKGEPYIKFKYTAVGAGVMGYFDVMFGY